MLRSTCIAAAFAVLTLAPLHPVGAAPTLHTKSIESITGLEGNFDKAEQVFKVSKPRDDVKVVVAGWTLPSFMGTGSWAAFKSAGEGAMLMGDTVLFEDEVNPAMSAALDAGLEVTALHNHFFFDEPKVYFMHIAGMGDAKELARGVKAVYDAVDRVRAKEPKPQALFGGRIPAKSSITPRPIEELLGEKAQTKDGMAKIVIGRSAQMHGVTMGKAMGVNTWPAFAGSDEQAVVDGDFAMHENELQPVLKAMRDGGINIVAIHHHMTHEKPRYIFLHYWGKGPALELTKTVRAALDAQAASK